MAVTGTFESAEKVYLYLDIHIRETPVTFRVGQEIYDSVDKKSFFTNVKPGMKITLVVEKGALEQPKHPLVGPRDGLVFVDGLIDEKRVYLSLAAREAKHRENQAASDILAVVLTVIIGGFFVARYSAARQATPNADS